MNYEEMLKEFEAVFGHPHIIEPHILTRKESNLRVFLLNEEIVEYWEAVDEQSIVGIADALADIVYIVIGTAVVSGIPFDEVFREVHRSNMSKFADGLVLRADGKLLKGDSYSPPNILSILGKRKQGPC